MATMGERLYSTSDSVQQEFCPPLYNLYNILFDVKLKTRM